MNERSDRKYVTCPHCGCSLREGRVANHAAKVHGKPLVSSIGLNPRGPSAERKKQKRGRVPKFPAHFPTEAYAERLKSAQRKCEVPSCQTKVIPPEVYCEPCKTKKIAAHSPSVPSGYYRRCYCGAMTVGGEDRCYSCLGD